MQKKSFTLVELMIVIAILAILSAIVIFALNPARLFDNFRDSKRVTDIQSINKAIVFMESWNQSGITYGTTTNVYVSLPDSNPSCTSYTLPTLPAGFAYYCSSPTNYKNTDGTGWIPINFTVEGSNKYLSNLPVDPVNNSQFFYTYYSGGSYELTALLKNPNANSINDDDSLTGAFTLGSPNRSWTSPLSRDTNLVLHLKFDEGSGTIAYDSSGNNRNGTLTNGPVATTTAYGEKVLYFDGTNDYITTSSFAIPNTNGVLSISAWVNCTSQSFYQYIMSDVDINNNGFFWFERHANSNNLYFYYSNGSTFVWPYSEGFFTNYNNQWVLAMAIADYNNRNIKWYRNGVLFTTYSAPGNMIFPIASGIKRIGSDYSGGSNMKGYLDDIRLYNRALSASEISHIYNQSKAKYQ